MKQTGKKTSHDGADDETRPERPQRYSATSGIAQIPLKKRTWTVDGGEDSIGESRKRSKKTKSRPRPMGTGVNSIPVG